ncbi:MAG: DUF3459 domain-containing protein, partial [Rhodococcus sp.]|nr:DUF3459 domain-containing protein [Rhodococcus sp. (in: high G+C Gram-positive bacteria)]
LNWSELGDGDHARLLAVYRDLLALRRERTERTDPLLDHVKVEYDEDAQWIAIRRGRVSVVCNLSESAVTVPVGGSTLLEWEPTTSNDTGSATTVPGHSFAVLES